MPTSHEPTPLRSSWSFVPYTLGTRKAALTPSQKKALGAGQTTVITFPASEKDAEAKRLIRAAVTFLRNHEKEGWTLGINQGHKEGEEGAFEIRF